MIARLDSGAVRPVNSGIMRLCATPKRDGRGWGKPVSRSRTSRTGRVAATVPIWRGSSPGQWTPAVRRVAVRRGGTPLGGSFEESWCSLADFRRFTL